MRRHPREIILYPPPKPGAPYIILIELGDGHRVHQYADTEEEAKAKISAVPAQTFRTPPWTEEDGR